MIFDSKTVLILGAGASAPYGFPLGPRLKEMIIDQIADETSPSGRNLYLDAGFSHEDIAEFQADLVRSINSTIDAFLEDRPSRRSIGAFAIAAVLMPLETESALFPHKDWYPKLFRELSLTDFESDSNISTILTFNYDRSVEHYLTETTKRTYENQVQMQALAKLRKLPIIHMHGQLGDYPATPYSPQKNVEELKKGAEGIRMIHDEGIGESDGFAEARQALKDARDVVFLGFGYDIRSLNRLDLYDHVQERTIFGSAHAVTLQYREEIEKLFEAQKVNLDTANDLIDSYFSHFHYNKLQERKRAAQAGRA
jgi:hypothetical protein